MRRISRMFFMMLLALALVAAGCSNSSSSGSSGGNDTIEIAYLTPGLDLPFWKYLSDGIQAEAEKQGYKYQVYDSHNSSADQLKNAQDAITKRVDVIIISPTDSSSAPAVLKEAENAGIPVIIADIGTDSGNYESLIISDNRKGAMEVGEYLANAMKGKGWNDGAVAQVTISLARKNGQERTKGFEDAVTAAGFQVVDIKQMEKYTRAEAEGFAQDLMTAHPNLRAIFGQTDEPTLGIVKAVQAANKANDIFVVGFDATPETIEKIRTGEMLAASVQQPVLMGREAFKAAMKVLNGESVEKQVNVPTLLVTKDNVDEMQSVLEDTVFPPQ